MLKKQAASSTKENAHETILQLARKYKAESLCQSAEDLYKQAINIARTIPTSQSRLLLESLHELANYLAFQGKEEQAEPLWDEIKSHASQLKCSSDSIYIDSIFHLALLYEKQTKIEKALILYKELLHIQEADFGDESLEICPTLDWLAAFYCRQQNYALAEGIYLRILVIKEFHLGTCSVEINYTVNSLIDIFQKLNKWRLAEYMLSRQSAILVALHGEESLCVASCALRLADLQANHDTLLDKAIENLSFAVNVYQKRFGDQAAPVILLQQKLDQMRLSGLENTANQLTDQAIITKQLAPQQAAQKSTAYPASSLVSA